MGQKLTCVTSHNLGFRLGTRFGIDLGVGFRLGTRLV